MKHYSVRQFRESYAQKEEWERQFPVNRFVFRPLSFYAASAVSSITHSAPVVAMAGFVTALAGLVCLVHIGSLGPWPGIALMTLYSLSDAVDGNIARATGTVTYFGKLLDGVLGLLSEGFFFPAIGIGLHLAGAGTGPLPGGPWLHSVLGAGTLVFMLYGSIVEGNFGRYSSEKERGRGTAAPPPDAKIGSSRYRGRPLHLIYLNLQSFNVQLIALSILTACGRMELFLPAAFGFYALKLLVVAPYYLRRAAAELS